MLRHRRDDKEEPSYEDEERSGRGTKRSRTLSDDEEEDDGEQYGRDGGGRSRKKNSVLNYIDNECSDTDGEEEEDEEDVENGFFDDGEADTPGDNNGRRMHPLSFLPREDDVEDVEALERSVHERYSWSNRAAYDEKATKVEQQALLPSVKDPKLWMVKCVIGREKEVAACLMQKCIDRRSDLQIMAAVALDNIINFIYIEAYKEAHVREACKGLRCIDSHKVTLVPIREMTDLLSVESKAVDLARDTWVRMKIGIYKGDLAKVVDVDNINQRIKVKLIPRIDLQALASKQECREVVKKKTFVPPRFMNVEEAREFHIHVEHRRDRRTGDYFESIEGMMFKDGFLYKTVSMKSITCQNISPTVDELEKFRKGCMNGEGYLVNFSTLFENRKKGYFMNGDAVIIVKGDLKNLKGWVEKVENGNVHIRPDMKGLPETLAVKEKELCKYFETGNHVKIVTGEQEGVTGMVVKVEGHELIILSDATNENIRVFSDYVAETSEVSSSVNKIADYELHDLVELHNHTFGVIIRVESQALQVLQGVAERPEVVIVNLREIKAKITKKFNGQDRNKNTVSFKDVVRIVEGPCKGKRGPVEHIYRGMLFISDSHHSRHSRHAGFICAKSQSCVVEGGSHANGDRNGDSYALNPQMRTPFCIPQSLPKLPRGAGGSHRCGGGHDPLIGTTVKVRQGVYKGHIGHAIEVKGTSVRVQLETKVVSVDRNQISDNVDVATPHSATSRYGSGNETPMHPSQTLSCPYMTPMRDAGGFEATPIHDGIRTPMRDPAWNPYAPLISPQRTARVG